LTAAVLLAVAAAVGLPAQVGTGSEPINLGGVDLDGGPGVWIPRDRTVELGRRSTLAPVETIPFQPWARALYEDRQLHELEPHARCKASGVARRWQTPYGVEFVQVPELRRIYLFDIGGPHTFHVIYMDGRTHPADFGPNGYGHSIGWWEDGTLVVDTVGFNEDFWIDRTGLPHTGQLHTIERFTRVDADTMRYEVTIDDPGAYTEPWTGGFNLAWSGGTELFEYICQESNLAPELQVAGYGTVDRTSPIVP
jgi:hypothetical protein